MRGTRRLKMGFNSVERMLRNVVHRMKSENYNGFHASAVMVLQIVLERSLEIKQAYLKWTMVEFRGVDLCTERDQMQCEMLDCRVGHDATEACRGGHDATEACRGGHDATKACRGGHDATEACV